MTRAELKKKAGLVIDTNLLLLYLMGIYDPKKISQFKRTQQFLEEDFQLLLRFIEIFDKVIITPHILAETTNLADTQTFPILKTIIELLEENLTSSLEIIHSDQTCFNKFGLSDTAIQYLAQQNYVVLTDDLRLYHYLSTKGYTAFNFNHLRSGNLLKK
ncbi:hypothetical protein [Runella salmonicolor]|uniref:PIN domain-containing protein n=1 Tax=Runella salmonicolor TaxID=2950278 RepID=A0ABT1FIH2_9BACT|nr:hypothetical protein [Runella salmonicolor]MCP1381561.1 hypothetical protein [Runella salmonicolor]